jgi:hypothetical protein
MGNRLPLALTGLALLGAGGGGLATGLGAFGRARADRPVWDGALSGDAMAYGWFWPLIAGLASVLATLGLGWLLVQARGRTPRRPVVGAGDRASRSATRAAVRALTADVGAYPGVRRVRVRLCGPIARPRACVRVTCDDDADLALLGRRVRDEAIARLRAALERDDLVGVLVFRVSRGDRPPERQAV